MAQRPPGSRSDPDTRKGSVLLSGLMLTPDDALEVFRDRRAADPELGPEHLARARDILDALQLAITQADPERWRRVEQAWLALCGKPAWLERPTQSVEARLLERAGAKQHSGDAELPTAERDAKTQKAEKKAEPKQPAPLAVTDSAAAKAASLSRTDEPARVDARAPLEPAGAPLPRPDLNSPWISPSAASLAKQPPAQPAKAPARITPPPPARVATAPVEVPPPAALPAALPALAGGDALAPWLAKNPSLAAFAAMVDDGDATIVPQARASGPALPFQPAADDEPPATAPRGRVDTAPPAAMPQPGPSTPWEPGAPEAPRAPAPWEPSGETAVGNGSANGPALPFDELDADPESTMARDTAAPPPSERRSALDVEGYAALCAQCAVWPEWQAHIQLRYGIHSVAERAQLDAFWAEKLAADPALAEAYRWHYQRQVEWCQGQVQG